MSYLGFLAKLWVHIWLALTLTATPPNVAFPNTVVGHASQPAIVTITNGGTDSGIAWPLEMSGSSAFKIVPGGTCSKTLVLAPGQSCTVFVTFTPSATGTVNATMTVGSPSPPAGFKVLVAMKWQ